MLNSTKQILSVRRILLASLLSFIGFLPTVCAYGQEIPPAQGKALAENFVNHIELNGSPLPEIWQETAKDFNEEPADDSPAQMRYKQAVTELANFLKGKNVVLDRGTFEDRDLPFVFEEDQLIIPACLEAYLAPLPQQFDPNSLFAFALDASPEEGYALDYFMRDKIDYMYPVVYGRKKDAPRIPSADVLEYVLGLEQDYYKPLSDLGFTIQGKNTPIEVLALVLLQSYCQQFYRPHKEDWDNPTGEFFFSTQDMVDFLNNQLARLKPEDEDSRKKIEDCIEKLKSRECSTTLEKKGNTLELQVYRTTDSAKVVHEVITLSATSPHKFQTRKIKEELCAYPKRL